MPGVMPWTQRLYDVLADGRWHTRDELIALAGPLVPPGRALRERERIAAHSNSGNLGERYPENRGSGPRPHRSTEYLLAVGRRNIIVQTLAARRFERRRDASGVTWVRLKP